LEATSPGQVSPRWKHYVDLVLALTIKEFKVRYKRTVLGYG
jgi:ABC-type polysaccharide/polyol phosphate export permease